MKRAVFEHLPNGVCVTGTDGKIILMNATAREMVGMPEDDLVGTPVTDLYVEDIAPPDLPGLRRGKRLFRETELRKAGEGTVPVLITYGVLALGDGDEWVIETWTDQTVRRRLDRVKNEFVYIAAHELRNPVTAMQLLLDIIFEDRRLALEPLLRNYLLKMSEANQRLLQLVDDLLEVSRSEIGRLKIEVKEVDIVSQVNTIISELRPTALSRGVRFAYRPGPNVPQVLADPSKLKEVLSNLISNAVKYNVENGTVTVTHDIEGESLVTRVQDTGIGIRKEDMPKLFGKLWRSEDMAVRAQAGTGLGLFIVKELVERMGGSIDAESTYGKGATFVFTLPLAKE